AWRWWWRDVGNDVLIMNSTLQTLVTNSASIGSLPLGPRTRLYAYLISRYGGLLSGVFGSAPNTVVASIANQVASSFQGFNDENYLNSLIYQIATRESLSTDGASLNAMVDATWGGANGVVNAQPVDALIKFGNPLLLGADMSRITL